MHPKKTFSEWTGTASISSSGTYSGTSDNTYAFTVAGSYGSTYTIGTDTITVTWIDANGETGSFEVGPGDVGTSQDIAGPSAEAQGVYVSLSGDGNTVVAGDTFVIRTFPSGLPGIAELLKEELEGLTDSVTGPMNVLLDNYDGIITNIETKVENEEARLVLVEQRLTEKFAGWRPHWDTLEPGAIPANALGTAPSSNDDD